MYHVFLTSLFSAVIKVSREFFAYKSGVYRCSNVDSRSRTGYLAVRILGWGEEYQNGKIVKYWVCLATYGQII